MLNNFRRFANYQDCWASNNPSWTSSCSCSAVCLASDFWRFSFHDSFFRLLPGYRSIYFTQRGCAALLADENHCLWTHFDWEILPWVWLACLPVSESVCFGSCQTLYGYSVGIRYDSFPFVDRYLPRTEKHGLCFVWCLLRHNPCFNGTVSRKGPGRILCFLALSTILVQWKFSIRMQPSPLFERYSLSYRGLSVYAYWRWRPR